MSRFTPILVALLIAAPLFAAPRDPLAGRIAGPPQQCIDLRSGQGGMVIDRNTIIYDGTQGRKWRVAPTGPCPSLRPMTTLITEVRGGQICRNDRFSLLEPGRSIPSAPCRFGSFVPYTRPK